MLTMDWKHPSRAILPHAPLLQRSPSETSSRNMPHTGARAPTKVASAVGAQRSERKRYSSCLTPPREASNSTSNTSNTTQLRNDRLGTLVSKLSRMLESSTDWESFVQQFRGRSYLSDDIDTVPHEAAPLLRKWKDEGIPVLTSEEPWSLQTKDERLSRGCHLSAHPPPLPGVT